MAAFGQDVRYALRGWRRRPLLPLAVILMLALGIGATTTVFAAAYAELWQPWPIRDPGGLVNLIAMSPRIGQAMGAADYLRLGRVPGFQDVAARSWDQRTLSVGAWSQALPIARITPDLLPLLGVTPELGRNFLASEAQAGHDGEALVSDGLWRRRFGGSRNILGRNLKLDDRAFIVIGVLPERYAEFDGEQVWIPLLFTAQEMAQSGFGDVVVVGRLRAGVTWQKEQPVLASFSKAFELHAGSVPLHLLGVPLAQARATEPSWPLLRALLSAVGLVLLIACANIAGLLLARGTAREQEIAIRRALGAGRARIVRQLLTEGLLLGAAGGGAGILSSVAGIRLLRASPLQFEIDRLQQTHLQPMVLGVAVATTGLATLLFSLVPAMRLSRNAPGPRSELTTTGGQQRLGMVLLAAEVALALVLAVGAGLMAKSLIRLTTVPTGFDLQHLATASFDFTMAQERNPTPRNQLLAQRVFAAAGTVPGLESVALTDTAPPGVYRTFLFRLPAVAGTQTSGLRMVSSTYFTAVREPLLAGRFFDDRDTAAAPYVAIVNQAWVRQFSPHASPLGLTVLPALAKEHYLSQIRPFTVVGMVADARDGDEPGMAPEPELFFCMAQMLPDSLTVVAHSARPAAASEALREAVHKAVPELAVDTAEAGTAIFSDEIALPRFQSLAMIGLAGTALLLALAGIWALVAFAVRRREREFGIRLALGASGGDILATALRQAVLATGLGLAVGLAGSWAATRLLASLLFEVQPTDAATYALVTVVFAVVALLAAYLPARRALGVDPAVVLRCE